MGILSVTQLESIRKDDSGDVMQIAYMPAISSENITTSGTSAQSTVFADNCNYVRLDGDTTERILFGANPTALSTSTRLRADNTEYFAVKPGQKLAAINE